jgi:hypothetical protein
MKATWTWSDAGWTAVDGEAWNRVAGSSGPVPVALDARHVEAMLGARERHVAAVRWWEGDRLVGIAIVEDTVAESRALERHVEARSPLFRAMSRVVHGRDGVLKFPVRVVGHVLGSGDAAYRFVPEISAEAAAEAVDRAVRRGPAGPSGRRPGVVLVKDFPVAAEAGAVGGSAVWRRGWFGLEFDPVMRVPVGAEWSGFSDYLGALKTKARTKVNRIAVCSEGCEFLELSLDEVQERAEALHSLYLEVYSGAAFRLGGLHAEDLVRMKAAWGEQFRVISIRHDGEEVGFLCGFLGEEGIEAFMVGFRPGFQRELALYQRMLIEFIRWGVESGSPWVNLGRTALDIKSSVGALPFRMAMAVRFRNPLLHALARWAARLSRPRPVELKQAWRSEVLASVLGQAPETGGLRTRPCRLRRPCPHRGLNAHRVRLRTCRTATSA